MLLAEQQHDAGECSRGAGGSDFTLVCRHQAGPY
jgi:hypothetical protein